MLRIPTKPSCWLACWLLSASAPLLQAQAQPAASPANATIRANVQEVVLDLIVRDKKGREVTDLKPEEIEIYDNETKQVIKGFRLVQGREAIAKGSTSRLDPLRQVRLVTIVVERLGQEGRRLARQAALDLIKSEQAPNVYYAVMSINQQLSLLQPFTADQALLRKAIEKATGGQYSQFAAESDNFKRQLESQLQSLNGPANGQDPASQIGNATAGGASGPEAGAAAAGAGVQAKMAQVMLDMLQFSQSMAREQAGRSSIYSLLSVVRGQQSLPGRKTVLYFSEGLVVPVSLTEEFNAVISSANRANVSVYALDARGLQTTNDNRSAIDELAGAASSSRSAQLQEGGPVRPDQVKALDRAEESLRANVTNSLASLAESTGGFLISNTNDLRAPLRRMSEDINTYYEATYDPAIENFDGRFRKISVRATRPDLRVQARSGYFALPTVEGGTMLFPYEVPLLKVLSATPLPRHFAYRTMAMHFQPAKDGVQCALAVEVPMKNLTFVDQPQGQTYKAHLSLVAMVKDAQGTVVKRFRRDLPLQGGSDKKAAVQAGNFIYLEHFRLMPGRYVVESAVMDQEASKASARRLSFMVPPARAGVNLSNVMLVRRVEPKQDAADITDPFLFSGGKVTPTLTETVAAGKTAPPVSAFFSIYPDAAIADKPQLLVEFVQDGQTVGRATPELPAADAQGRIAYVVSSPAESFKPGSYELRVTVKQGPTTAQESTLVTVE